MMQAFKDYWYRFIDIYIGWPGSVHDVQVLTNSDVFAKGEEGMLPPNSRIMFNGCNVLLLILGDLAYSLLSWLLKVYSDSGTLKQL